jgi:hypothetical protein
MNELVNPLGGKIVRGFLTLNGPNGVNIPCAALQSFDGKLATTYKEFESPEYLTAAGVSVTGQKMTGTFDCLVESVGMLALLLGGTADTTTAVANPTVAPTLAAAAGGALAAGHYQVGYTYTNSDGESAISPLAIVTVTANQKITTTSLGALPTGVTGVNWYMTSGVYATDALAQAQPVYYIGSNTGGAMTLATAPTTNAGLPPTLSSIVNSVPRYTHTTNTLPNVFSAFWKTPDSSGAGEVMQFLGCVLSDIEWNMKFNDYIQVKGNFNCYGVGGKLFEKLLPSSVV